VDLFRKVRISGAIGAARKERRWKRPRYQDGDERVRIIKNDDNKQAIPKGQSYKTKIENRIKKREKVGVCALGGLAAREAKDRREAVAGIDRHLRHHHIFRRHADEEEETLVAAPLPPYIPTGLS
jgi:hypothetical protein